MKLIYLPSVNKSKFFLLTVGGVVIFILLFFKLLILPQYQVIMDEKESKNKLQQIVELSQVLPANIQLLKSKISNLQNILNQKTKMGDSSSIESMLIKIVQELAWSHDLTIGALVPSNVTESQNIHKLGFKVELSGQYADVYNWLAKIEKKVQPIYISYCEIKKNKQVAEPPSVSAIIHFSYYWGGA